jgi:dihydrodipicolinate synthase/N-acetylneuraminate lyase
MLLASLAMAGAGTICANANIAPSWVVKVFDDFERGDLDAARTHQDLLLELTAAVRTGVFPAGVKAALHLQGVCEQWPAPPVAALDEDAERRLGEQLQKWGLLAGIAQLKK